MQDILTRGDIVTLVHTFYKKVRKDELIGPFFNSRIQTDLAWEEHENKLVDFWESTLFLTASYSGNPMRVHLEVDKENGYDIEQNHFGRWLLLWISNIQEQFEGEKANLAKERARNIAHHMHMRMFMSKPEKSKQV